MSWLPDPELDIWPIYLGAAIGTAVTLFVACMAWLTTPSIREAVCR